MRPICLLYPLPAPTTAATQVLIYGGRQDVEVFQRNLRHGHSVRGNTRVPPVVECRSEDSRFTVFKGYNRTQYSWAPGLTVQQVVIGKDPEHVVWPQLLTDPDWTTAGTSDIAMTKPMQAGIIYPLRRMQRAGATASQERCSTSYG